MKHEVDTTGLKCPLPVLRARRFLSTLQRGEVLILTASDPASVKDVPAFCRTAGHQLIMVSNLDGMYVFEIEKGAGLPLENVEQSEGSAVSD